MSMESLSKALRNEEAARRADAATKLSREQIMEACEESRKRMNDYTPEQRKALGERAMKIIFPEGFWRCGCGIANSHGKPCPVCHEEEKL